MPSSSPNAGIHWTDGPHGAANPSPSRPRVAVIGGGVSGVACAYRLKRAGIGAVIFERSDQVGGRVRTVRRNGFCFDTGAGALASTSGAVGSLLRSMGVERELVQRGVTIGVLREGKVERVSRRQPQSLLGFGALSASSKLALWRLAVDFARIYRRINPLDLSPTAPFDTQSVREYAQKRLPREVFDYLIAPLTRALFLVEPEQTSVVDLFAAMKAFLVADSIWTHPDGLGFFAHRAARELDVRLNAEIVKVIEDESGIDLFWTANDQNNHERFDAAVLAVPAPEVLRMHSALDRDRASYLKALDYSATIVVNLGVRHAPDEEASMVLVPRMIDPRLPVIGLGHNLAPGRAPAGAGILTAFWIRKWSQQHWDSSDQRIVDLTRDAINQLFPGWADAVEESHVTRWSPALVASQPGTFAGLTHFADRCRLDRRIRLAGDYHAQTSVNASVGAGQRAAAQTARFLRAMR